jgi:hypothetical protein
MVWSPSGGGRKSYVTLKSLPEAKERNAFKNKMSNQEAKRIQVTIENDEYALVFVFDTWYEIFGCVYLKFFF